MDAKYLIFGATGSIGSNLVSQLYNSNQNIHLVARNEQEVKSLSEKFKCTYSIADVLEDDFIKPWEYISQITKPTIAAVNGYALGGGCELAMMCDLIFASEKAIFGQPEINLGTFPGAGGTQRLPKFVGKAVAMDLILTARTMKPLEAESLGLVSRVLDESNFIEETLDIAKSIAEKSLPILKMAKAAVNGAFENTLSQGVLFEKKLFQSTFALEDRKEGMKAFIEKRKPNFKNK